MNNLEGNLEVFIITNGRSTFPYCHKSVNNQVDVKFKKTIIKDMGWLEANRKILSDCKSKYFLRVDDDMLLHPKAVKYMWKQVEGQDSLIAARTFLLWETYSSRIIRGIKIYNRDISREIGFIVNKLGKIDKPFSKKVKGSRYRLKTDKNVVALHSCSSIEEHLKYAFLRGEDAGKGFKDKKRKMSKNIGSYNKSVEKQFDLVEKIVLNLGKKHKTNFYKFLKNDK